MIVAVVLTLLVVWGGIGALLALLIGRTARVADDRQQDALLLGALDEARRADARLRDAPTGAVRLPAGV